MKYQKKPVIVDAVQWNKHGDHPEVISFTDKWKDLAGGTCHVCRRVLSKHGYLAGLELHENKTAAEWMSDVETREMSAICPSDWVVTEASDKKSRTYLVCSADFEKEFEPVDEIALAIKTYDPGPVDAVTRMWHYYQEKYKILWPNHPEREKAAKVYIRKAG